MKDITLNGEYDIISTLNIALLCLKHRINKNQKQRIIILVGSPIYAYKESLVQIGKKLRKYNVTIDIISFGNVEENRESLNTLLTEANNY
jgi:26S proteasome regulatory subunit N10